MPDLGDAEIVWYTPDNACDLPLRSRTLPVWLLNGNQLPLVDLPAARAAVRRGRTDVLVFGSGHGAESPRYTESVVVGKDGEVVRCVRHYSDSPEFTDLWAGEASFLVASGDRAAVVVRHVLARGWRLESVGALTRRFSVRWAPTNCVFSLFAAPDTGDTTLGPGEIDDTAANVTVNGILPRNGVPEFGESPRRGTRSYVIGDDSRSIGRGAASTMSAARAAAAIRGTDLVSWLPTPIPEFKFAPGRGYLWGKRVMDIVFSLLGLIVFSPLLLVVALLVRCTSRGPILFAHKRQGMGGRVFGCWKFRTMCADADGMQAKLRESNEVDGPQFKMADDPRLTRVGRYLRDLNLDELPQLLNVLSGQMSLIGPRPSPDNENQRCPAWRRARLSVKPGISGLWQVLRRRRENQSDFQEWIYYDMEYARHRTLWLDLRILFYTPVSMFAPRFVRGFVKRLRAQGICVHSAWLPESEEAVIESAA